MSMEFKATERVTRLPWVALSAPRIQCTVQQSGN